MKNRLRAAIITLSVGVTAMLGIAPASAAGCDLGYTCQWQGEQYTGTSWGNSIVAQNWGLGQYDTASGVHAHGRDCKATTYYKGPDFTDINFTINSQKVGGNFKDPYLKNGAGTQPGVDFDNNLSSYSFINCA